MHVIDACRFEHQVLHGSYRIFRIASPAFWKANHTKDGIPLAKAGNIRSYLLYRATHKLCPSGILIWIVPQSSLKPAASFLASNYERLACVRFPDDLWQPDPEKQETVSLYGQFHQIVLFAQKRAYEIPPRPETVQIIQGWANSGADLPVLPLEGRVTGVPVYTIPNARSRELSRFSSSSFDPDETARRVSQISAKTLRYQTGVWTSADYLAARLPDAKAVGFGIGRPMASL